MSSISSRNRIRASREIERLGVIAQVPCDRCYRDNVACIMMEDSSSKSKCAACTRRGKPCVSVPWENLDRTRDELEHKIDQESARQSELLLQLQESCARLDRFRKVLRQAEERAKAKTICLLEEIGQEDVIISDEERRIHEEAAPYICEVFGPRLLRSFPLRSFVPSFLLRFGRFWIPRRETCPLEVPLKDAFTSIEVFCGFPGVF